jgi:hypothetical protein
MAVTATTDNKPVVVIEGPPTGGPSCIESSRFQKLPSIDHVAAGAFGFLIFSHAFDGPDLYGASSFFETWSSQFASDRDPSQLSLKADLIALLSCYSGPLTHHKLEAPSENGRHG